MRACESSLKQEDLEFGVSLGHGESSRLAWATEGGRRLRERMILVGVFRVFSAFLVSLRRGWMVGSKARESQLCPHTQSQTSQNTLQRFLSAPDKNMPQLTGLMLPGKLWHHGRLI